MNITEDIIMKVIEHTKETVKANIGGPFGAAVIDSDGTVLSITSNSVLGDNDPTAHAEVNAIREAAKKKGTYDLSGCILYSTGYPCPMCLGAIIWANIKTVYYSCEPKDAEAIGFRDQFMYDFIKDGLDNERILRLLPKGRELCLELFELYDKQNKAIY